MEAKRTMIASQLIIEAGELYHKRPTQLKFEELVDVVQAVVKNCNIQPVIKSVCPNCGNPKELITRYDILQCIHCGKPE